MTRLLTVVAVIVSGALLSGCGALAVGAAGAVAADKIYEQEKGGDGLF